jgi:hypothetical protein
MRARSSRLSRNHRSLMPHPDCDGQCGSPLVDPIRPCIGSLRHCSDFVWLQRHFRRPGAPRRRRAHDPQRTSVDGDHQKQCCTANGSHAEARTECCVRFPSVFHEVRNETTMHASRGPPGKTRAVRPRPLPSPEDKAASYVQEPPCNVQQHVLLPSSWGLSS